MNTQQKQVILSIILEKKHKLALARTSVRNTRNTQEKLEFTIRVLQSILDQK